MTTPAIGPTEPHPRQRWFLIIYGVLLLVCPTPVFMFVYDGTLSVIAWVIFAFRFDVDALLALQIIVGAVIQGFVAFAFAAVVANVRASTRHFLLLFGAGIALAAATRPLYCYAQGVNTSVGGCTNAIAALWLRR